MNFAGKKLNGYYSDASDISAREKVLLAENKKLKSKNKRLSTAMLYLVDQIEIRLPFWTSKKSKPTAPASVAAQPAPTPMPKPVKRKIVGKAWMPEKIDYTPGVPIATPRRNRPLNIHEIFSKRNQEKAPALKTDTLKTPQSMKVDPTEKEELEIELEQEAIQKKTSPQPSNGLSPDLAPEEVNLLAAPKKDNYREITERLSSEQLIEREEKKTSAKEASLTYLAVSMASSPVPEHKELNDENTIEHQVAVQSDIMREAMLRRVNRLRW